MSDEAHDATLLASETIARVTGACTFAPGDRVANRYTIVRFIARGGMGEVYEADDLELQVRVALKTVIAEVADDARTVARFKREIQIARQVTHPNVCRIFDVGVHESITFLTMELLPGQTLTALLEAQGRLEPAEALPIVRQMAAALDAAHDAGIVHRDFKSPNVMLVGDRAVVTDFGLAKGSSGKADALTGTGAFLGSPAYMAPEQVEGGEITRAADIYALGVVMYEMVTGKLPFVGENPLATAVKRLSERPAPPRTHVPNLDRGWQDVILRCLERKPAVRFARAGDVAVALTAKQRRFVRPMIFSSLAALVLLGGGVIAHRLRQAPGPGAGRRCVSLLGFKNSAGRADAAWLSTALSEMLSAELAAGERLRVVPGEQVARMRADLQLPEADSYTPETLGRIARQIDSQYVVLGSYVALGKDSGGQIRLDVRLQDTRSGETTLTMSDTGTERELFALVSRAGGRLRDRLGASATIDPVGVRTSLPADPDAARLYAEALAKQRTFDRMGAKELFERALAKEPTFALGHARLAQVYTDLGHDPKALEASKRAFDLSASLPKRERLLIEARYRECNHEMDRAIAIYRDLFELFPGEIEYGLLLAETQNRAQKWTDALATVGTLRKLPSDDPRLDFVESWAAGWLGQVERTRAAANRALAKAEAMGSKIWTATAKLQVAAMLHDTGELDRAMQLAGEARQALLAAGDRQGASLATFMLAWAHYGQDKLSISEQEFLEVLETRRADGNDSGMLEAFVSLAMVYVRLGKFPDALQILDDPAFKRAAPPDKQLQETGFIKLRQGDPAAARKIFEDLLPRLTGPDQLFFLGPVQGYLGEALLDQDELPRARALLDQSIQTMRKIGYKQGVAQQQLPLARLALAERRYADALTLTDELTAALKDFKAHDALALTDATRALALAALGRRPEAEQALARAQSQLASTEDPRVTIRITLAAARIHPDSPTGLREASQLAHKSGFIAEALEADLLLAKQDKPARARIAREAKGRGMLLIAREAVR